jgi:hypothetical protein
MQSNRRRISRRHVSRGLVLGSVLALLAGCNDASPERTQELAALESRVAAVEARVEELGARSAGAAALPGTADATIVAAAAPSAVSPGGAEAPVSVGYEGVYVKLHVGDQSEVKLAVNGRVVGTYSSPTNLYLDSMLARGAMNTIGAMFSAAQEGNAIEIQVQSRGDDRWNPVFNFMPKGDKLESSFEVPYLGKADSSGG